MFISHISYQLQAILPPTPTPKPPLIGCSQLSKLRSANFMFHTNISFQISSHTLCCFTWPQMHLCRCDLLSNLTLPNSFEISIPNQTLLYTCTISIFLPLEILKSMNCNDYKIYYTHSNNKSPSFTSECSITS